MIGLHCSRLASKFMDYRYLFHLYWNFIPQVYSLGMRKSENAYTTYHSLLSKQAVAMCINLMWNLIQNYTSIVWEIQLILCSMHKSCIILSSLSYIICYTVNAFLNLVYIKEAMIIKLLMSGEYSSEVYCLVVDVLPTSLKG